MDKRKYLGGNLMKKIILFLTMLLCSITLLSCNDDKGGETVDKGISKDSVKILAIGNSFSDNAMNYLYPILEAFGAKEIKLGNMYIGGCSVDRHYTNLANQSKSYTYRKNTTGTFINTNGVALNTALVDEEWDFITFQQASDFSGILSSYNETQLNDLTSWAKAGALNPDVKIGWHMTWAYQGNSTHAAFPKYNKDQMFMYQQIVACVQQQIDANENFDFIIPAGTAVQNARTSYTGDTLTADGYHLNTLGEYIIGLTWVLQITGWSIEDLNIDLVPSQFKLYIDMIKESAVNAVENPYEVTPSQYLEKPTYEVDLNKYDLLEWEPKLGFWNSGASSEFIAQDAIANQFVSTSKRYTKEEIPVGSIILIEEGYGYRPDGWNTETGASTAARPNNVTTQYIEVDEAWWGTYQYRAFNVFKTPNRANMTGLLEETATKLKIYVPKK
jgi:hypothetical protein